MDDDKINTAENQSSSHATPIPTPEEPRTIFETHPTDLKPEEVSPELTAPEQVGPPDDNKKKYAVFAAIVVFFVIIFFLFLRFFFSRAAPSKKEIKLIYWGLWGEKETIQPLIDEYRSKNKNIKIEYQKMSPQDYREKLIVRSKAGQGPDIFRFHNTWIPEIKEVLAPLPKSVMDNGEFERTFYPIQRKDLKVGNHYFGIPLMIDGLVLVYNDSLFKKAGITNAPFSWEDVIDYVGKLTVKNKDGQIITSGMALGTASNVDHFSDIFGLFLVQNGGDIRKLDTEEASGALESYRKFAEPPDNFWDDTLSNSTSSFIQEKVAMIIVPSWEILTIKAANPEIDLKVIPVPTIPGSKAVSLATYWVEGVSRFSKNQEEAWKFLKFLSEKESMTKLYQLQSQTRLFGEPYSRVDLQSVLAQNEYVGAVMKQADSFVSIPIISRTYDNGLNDEIAAYIENAINATTQGVSYDAALKTAKLGVDQVFSKYEK